MTLPYTPGGYISRFNFPRTTLTWWSLGASLLPVIIATPIPIDHRMERFRVARWTLPRPVAGD